MIFDFALDYSISPLVEIITAAVSDHLKEHLLGGAFSN